MGISFERPIFLLISIPLILLTLFPFLKLSKASRRRFKYRVSLTLRLIAIVLITLLLSGFMTVRQTKKNSVIILADLSDSTKHVREQMNKYVKEAVEKADSDTKIGLMTFAYDTVYELPLSTDLRFTSFETSPRANHTDLSNAIIMANAMMPSDTNRRIILLTDGKQTIGDALNAARAVAAQGVRVDAIQLQTGSSGKEIQVNQINTPETIYEGEQFELTVEIQSNYKTDAILKLFSENEIKSTETISLQEGINKFVFTDTATSSGVRSYRVEVETKEDDVLKNNRMYSYIRILGTPRILIIDGSGSESHELVKIIGDSAQCDVITPIMAPTKLENLRKYESVILMNVQKSALPDNWDDMLELYVRQLGRGLLTIGGDKSYALGGWADSTLEKILPINVYQRNEAEISDLALAILIDNSGSMGQGRGSNLELAKEGAARAVRSLKSIDSVSVIAFSDNANRVVEMTSAKEKEYVISQISRIPPGGGTMMFTAMNMAYKDLIESDKSVKHIILLSDGHPADTGFEGLAEKMAKANITLTTISIGQEANSGLLKELAEKTGGRNYDAVNALSLPDIMLKETFLAMGDYLNNETFVPKLVQSSPVLKGITSFTSLHGYIGTEIKNTATLVLATEEQRPIYAEWQYGLGFVASYTSDLNGKWSSSLLEWDKGSNFIQNMVSRVLPSDEDPDLGKVETKREGDKGFIKAIINRSIGDNESNVDTIAEVISPSGKQFNVPLTLTGIGTYESSFVLEEEGNYLVTVVQSVNDKVVLTKESALISSYSDEYDAFIKSNEILDSIVKNTGGSVWDNIADILKVKIVGAKEYLGYTLPLLITTIIVLLTDIALRRLQLASLFRSFNDKASYSFNKLKEAYKLNERSKEYRLINITEDKKTKDHIDKDKIETVPVKKEQEKKPASSVSNLLEVKEAKSRKKL